ncbi:hypothetical protein DMA11_23760 [Marinilabiliaceae bacterium JC017]|nr:hypothetical protein DMA11_23760 [Marinilabiliaceae bacterium JC017]
MHSCGSGGLILELDEEDRHVIFRMIDTMPSKKKFKDFFKCENLATILWHQASQFLFSYPTR